MKLRRAKPYRRGRIEIIPMIDVMFFLLATFMIASLSMQNLNSLDVNLPQGQAPAVPLRDAPTLSVTREGKLFINRSPVALDALAASLKPLLEHSGASVIVAADDAASQGAVVKAMLKAREAGAEHLLIAVKRDE